MINARSIQGIIVLIVGSFLAIWLGLSLVTSQTETIIQAAGAMLLVIALLFGRKIWLLMIFLAAMNVPLFRGFGTIELGQLLFLAFTAFLFLMRKLRYRIRFGELEIWACLIIICILQAYMRNPVGLGLFGGAMVGGKPYIILALTITAAAVLSTLQVEAKELKMSVWMTMIGGFLGIPGTILRFGNVAYAVGDAAAKVDSGEGLDRIPPFTTVSMFLSRWIASRISPIRACLHPLWMPLLLVSIAAAAASGFRNSVANIGLIYLIGICYRSGLGGFVTSILGGSMALALLALINLNFPLPGNIQRALSPLPGTWEERYVRAGKLSTEWRIEMWKEALTSDRWIHNKILGDGIGISAEQIARNQSMDATQVGMSRSGMLVQQENMLSVGAYHSGPVHSVRMVGYVGLAVLLIAMIRLAMHAHRQIMRCRGTEWYPVALFFGIPLISQPIFFTFVFGEYHFGVAQTVMGIAMVRLMERNLPLPAYVTKRRRNHVPLVVSARSA